MEQIFMCVNPDKEEFITGKAKETLPECAENEANIGKTIEYLLATEWKNDRIVWTSSQMPALGYVEDSELSLFEYANRYYEERAALARVPEYRYLINSTTREYVDKNVVITMSRTKMSNLLPFLMIAGYRREIGYSFVDGKVDEFLGSWCGDPISVSNQLNGNHCFFKKIMPVFDVSIPGGSKSKGSFSVSGKNIVITGCVGGYDRITVETEIARQGGNPQKAITKSTDFLIVGSKPGASKLSKADKYGITKIDESELRTALGI